MLDACQRLYEAVKDDIYFKHVYEPELVTPPEIRNIKGELLPPLFEEHYSFGAEANRLVYDYDEVISFSCKPTGIEVEMTTRWNDLFVDYKDVSKMEIEIKNLGNPVISSSVQDSFDDVGYDDCMDNAKEDCLDVGLEGQDLDDCVKEAAKGCYEDNLEWWLEAGGYVKNDYPITDHPSGIIHDVKEQLDSIFLDMDKLVGFG